MSYIIAILLAVFAIFYASSSVIKIDKLVWCISWTAMFLLNGIFGGVYVQSWLMDSYVFACVVAFLLGGIFDVREYSSYINNKSVVNVKFVILAVVIYSAFGIFSSYDMASQSKSGIDSYLDADMYADTVRELNSDLRQGQLEQGILGKIFYALPQAALIISGLCLGIFEIKKKYRYLMFAVPVAPFVLFSIVSSLRSAIFMAIFIFLSSYLSGLVFKGDEKRVFNIRSAGIFIASVFVFVFVMIYFQSIRLGDYNFDDVGATVAHLRPWVAGYMPSFGVWHGEQWDGELSYGASSFRWIANFFRSNTGYADVVVSSVYLGNMQFGNASTVLRGFVNDFGLFGCWVFCFFWGYISSVLYQKTRRRNIYAAVFFSINIACIIWAPNQWFLSYGSRQLAPFLACALFLYANNRHIKF